MPTTSKRAFIPGVPNHVYQISSDCGVIFYDESDYLVCLSIIFTAASRHGVVISALCLMINHIHIQAECRTREGLSAFEADFTSCFTRLYNARHRRSGPLFRNPFGSAPKASKFDIMDNYVYICNNPVVKYLCQTAEDYRWNLCAYLFSDHPFSQRFRYTDASKSLLAARQRIKGLKARGQHLSYDSVDFYRRSLSLQEWRQLSDFIVVTYMDIDNSRIISLYGDRSTMFNAVHSSRGKENDLNEVSGGKDYRPYYRMLETFHQMTCRTGKCCPGPYPLDEKQKMRLAYAFANGTGASIWQIAAFLHLPYEQLRTCLRFNRWQ